MDDIEKARNMMVVKHNHLVQRSRHSLTLAQQKAIIYICSKIKPGSSELEFEFNIADYAEVCGIEKNGRLYEVVKSSLLDLTNIGWYLPLADGVETTVRWLSRATINKKSGIVKVKIDEYLAPFLLDLQEKTTRYQLYNVLSLTSAYAMHLYEILKSYAWTGQWAIGTGEFKEMFLLDAATYKNWAIVKRNVIDPAVRQISERTDLGVEYKDDGRAGRKAQKLTFTIRAKAPAEEAPAVDGGPMGQREDIAAIIHANIGYEILEQNFADREDELGELVGLIIDTVALGGAGVRVDGAEVPAVMAMARLLQLKYEHISYIMDMLSHGPAEEIRNPRAYLLAALYNAPMTIATYYSALYRHDKRTGKI
jgi:hypothetical protein